MAKLKVWKRWASIGGGYMSLLDEGMDHKDEGYPNLMCVMHESGHRRVMAVYRAAMKWHDVHEGNKLGCSEGALAKACEMARK